MIYNFDLIKEITADDILQQVSQIDLYSYYYGSSINPKNVYRCCFHDDNNPSMGFYRSNDYINFKCFSCNESGNVFNFIGKLNGNLNYYETLKLIDSDFKIKDYGIRRQEKSGKHLQGITGEINKDLFEKVKINIYPTIKPFSKIDYDYWNRYYISLEDLLYYDIYACSVVYYTNKSGVYKQYAINTKSNPLYAYKIGNNYKIYRPFSGKVGKWFTNTDNYDIQGMKQLSPTRDLLIITSSMKDVLVLYKMGYQAIAPQAEGMKIPDKIVDYLWATSNNIVVLYDSDQTGLKEGDKLASSIGCKSIFIPEKYNTKDISDYVEKYTLDKGKELMNNLLWKIQN